MSNTPYLPIIGLEVHAELKTKSKMFCGCKNDPFHAEKPNIYTCPVCLGMPGGLPVANKKAIEWTVKLGLALNCKINLFSKFDRKNYFYPDLAKGYQISQYDIPFCYDGVLETEEGPVRIRRIHLEEDTGKLQHRTIDGKKVSLIDFNRGGVPLIEIVTEPDMHSAKHARAYAKKLRQIIRDLDISDCDMEQGSMRLEANISLLKTDKKTVTESELPNYKVEVKNINSFSFLAKAIDYEIPRHTEILESGKTPIQETRGWDEDSNATFSQRTKEDAEDYRYFPDPDLPPIQFTTEQIEQWRSELPETAEQTADRWVSEYKLKATDAKVLAENADIRKQAETYFTQFSSDAAGTASLWVNKKIAIQSETTADQIHQLYTDFTKVDDVDESELQTAINAVISEQPKAVEQFKSGEEKVIGFLLGQVMKKLGKKVDVQVVRTALVKSLQ